MPKRFDPQMNGGLQLDLFANERASASTRMTDPVGTWAEANGLDWKTGSLGSAVLSPCGTYRYRLGRTWDVDIAPMVWVLLNPSTGDHDANDATIRRITAFSKAEGHGGLVVVNLFALRSKDPNQIRQHKAPVGPCNEAALIEATAAGARIAVAWGDVGKAERAAQARAVTALLTAHGRQMECLGLTDKGHPRHPLYVRNETRLTPYTPEVSDAE